MYTNDSRVIVKIPVKITQSSNVRKPFVNIFTGIIATEMQHDTSSRPTPLECTWVLFYLFLT